MRYSITCPTCKETYNIIRSPSKPAPVYCSRACRNVGLGEQARGVARERTGSGNSTRFNTICAQCKEPFETVRTPGQLARSGPPKFCSQACRILAHHVQNNPRFKG